MTEPIETLVANTHVDMTFGKWTGARVHTKKDLTSIARQVVHMHDYGFPLVMVTGGSVPIDEKHGLTERADGRRITTDPMMDGTEAKGREDGIEYIALETLDNVVDSINSLSPGLAIGVPYKNTKVEPYGFGTTKSGERKDTERVGKITYVDAEYLIEKLSEGRVVVIPHIGMGEDERSYNINAADVLSDVVIAVLSAMRGRGYKGHSNSIFFGGSGVKKNGVVIPEILLDEARQYIEEGIIKDGMVPNINAGGKILETEDGPASVFYVPVTGRQAQITEIIRRIGSLEGTRMVLYPQNLGVPVGSAQLANAAK